MKGILEFDLPGDRELFELSLKGPDLRWAVDDFFSWLRSQDKSGERDSIPVDEIRSELYECVKDAWVD